MPDFSKLLILGPGLLGGSLGLAAKERRLAGHVSLWGRREQPLQEALSLGAADTIHTNLREAASNADIVVFATPTRTFPQLAQELVGNLPKDATVTDVGSIKAAVCHEMEKFFPGRFIGAHPMAGAEKSGISYARADLFTNAACIITPLETTLPKAIDSACTLWTGLGCRIHRMPALEHDQAVARLSHLPHLIAAALVNSALAEIPEAWMEIVGPGFRDTTRVASGPPSMWAEILIDNRAAVASALAGFLCELEKISAALRADDTGPIKKLLTSAKDLRDIIIKKNFSP
jgi:prephenate dehydrogenase